MNLTVVLLPGLDGTGVQFAPLLEMLGKETPTHVVTYPSKNTHYDDHVSQVLSELPKKGRYIVLAESYSGPVAIKVAAQHPVGLAGLILCASFATCPNTLLRNFAFLLELAPPWKIPAEWVAPFTLGEYKTPQSLALLKEALSATPPNVLLERLKEVARTDASAEAHSIAVPTLYLRATHDRLVPESAVQDVANCIPGAIIRDLEGPHFLLQASANAASREIKAFASARAA